MKKIFQFIAFIFLPVLAPAQDSITLEELWLQGLYTPEYVSGIHWMENGEFYTAKGVNREVRAYEIVKKRTSDGEQVDIIVPASGLIPSGQQRPLLVNEYLLSPDETKVALSTNTEQIYRHSTRSEYYIYDRPSGSLDQISTGRIAYLTFSPDGNKVAYVRDNNLFYTDLRNLREVQVTDDGEHNAIINGSTDWVYEEEFELTKAFFWSPDSEKLAYYRFDESEVKEYNMQEWDGLYPSNYSFKYPKAGEENSEIDLFVHFLDSGDKQQLNLGEETDIYIPRVQWTHDEDILSVMWMNRLQNHMQIRHYNVTSGEMDVVYEEQSETYVEVSDDLSYMDDGFILTSEREGYSHIYIYNSRGKLKKKVTSGDWEVGEIASIDRENELIYYTSTEESPLERHLYVINFRGRNKEKVTEKSGYHEVDISPDSRYFLDYYSAADLPYEISIKELPSGNTVNQLVDNAELKNRLEQKNTSETEFFTITSEDGYSMNAWMIKPPDFDPEKEYPVLFTVYGGPGYQTVTKNWGSYNYVWYQYLAQRGYIVVSVDSRGTGGRGADFKKMTYGQLGKYEVEDLITSARHMASLEYVDGNRIGIFGWSYGGYLSTLSLLLGNDVFTMAIAVAPVTSWRFYDTIYTERYLGLPQDNPEGYDDYSPLSHADKLEGNYMLVHGTGDDNVHLQNSMEMQNALIDAGKHFDVFYYPDRDHGIYGGNTRHHLYEMMSEYIMENL